MFKKIESIINRSPFYNVIRFNALTDLLIESKTKRTNKAIAFYSSFLQTDSDNKLVFDIGANKGNKVKAFLRMGFKVVAVEPEKKSLSTLYWRFGKNRNINIIEKGISDKPDILKIHIADSRSGLNTLSDKWMETLESKEKNRWERKHRFNKSYQIETVTLDQLYSDFGVPHFIKIDVEGYENKVIKGMSQLPAFISFETNLPEFLQETIECITHLKKLSPNIEFNYSQSEKLVLDSWATSEKVIDLVRNPDTRYMEIICRRTA